MAPCNRNVRSFRYPLATQVGKLEVRKRKIYRIINIYKVLEFELAPEIILFQTQKSHGTILLPKIIIN